MAFPLGRLLRRIIEAALYSTLGAAAVLIVVFVVYLNSRADLEAWHLAELDEEFTASSGLDSFGDYLALEERLFQQLDRLVYGTSQPEQDWQINRYHRGSLSDPERWSPNWNRTFELPAKSPAAAVLLLHGMSDSPYSLLHLGERLNAAGAYVIGLRLPGHGTAPSGLVDITWQDMAAAVRLAVDHLSLQAAGRPLYLVGYSNGAALAVHYTLASLEDPTRPRVDRLVILSPAIGVTAVAALAVWQARLGHLLGLEKLSWNVIQPEYDPFKYGSFAVNAGDVVYRLTSEIQTLLDVLGKAGRLGGFPPILAFSSVVDATVSTPALVQGLFERLPAGGHELVLFDINQMAEIGPLLKSNPASVIQELLEDPDRTFVLNVVTNANVEGQGVLVRRKLPGKEAPSETKLDLAWPMDIYSLSHVALPFPADDSLYGGHPTGRSPGLHLGDIALRGERGVLNVSASDMLRLRWNPFYAFVEAGVLDFLELGAGQH